MSGRRAVAHGARTGMEVAQRRIASVAGMAAAAVTAVLALGACAIAAVFGSGPGFLGLLAIVAGSAVLCGLLVRAIVRRIDLTVLAALVARRIAGRRRG